MEALAVLLMVAVATIYNMDAIMHYYLVKSASVFHFFKDNSEQVDQKTTTQ